MSDLEGEVVSITYGRPAFKSADTDVLQIKGITDPSGTVLKCHGQARTVTGNYRLDFELAPGQTKFIPVVDVIKGKVPCDRFGITGQRGLDSVFVPLIVTSSHNKGVVYSPDSVFVSFIPRLLVKDYSLRVFDPRNEALLFTSSGTGVFDARQAITVAIPVSCIGSGADAAKVVVVYLESHAIGTGGTPERPAGKGPTLSQIFRVLLSN